MCNTEQQNWWIVFLTWATQKDQKNWVYHRWFTGELEVIWSRFSNISTPTRIVCYLKISDLEIVLSVEGLANKVLITEAIHGGIDLPVSLYFLNKSNSNKVITCYSFNCKKLGRKTKSYALHFHLFLDRNFGSSNQFSSTLFYVKFFTSNFCSYRKAFFLTDVMASNSDTPFQR